MTAMQSFAVGMLKDMAMSQRCHSDLHPTRTSSPRGSPLGVLHGRGLDLTTLALLPGEGARRQRHIFSIHSFRDNGRLVYPPPAGEVPTPCGGPGTTGRERDWRSQAVTREGLENRWQGTGQPQ